MNLELINRTLDVTENPGLDTLDPRFNDITTLVHEGDYLGAATQAEAVLDENIYDIRIIGYFLYGAFLEQGVRLMTAIFQCLSRLLQENWEAIGPVKKREKHAQISLNWLMKQLLKKLQYEEEKKGDLWDQWGTEVSSEEVQEMINAGEDLRRALGITLEDAAGPVVDGLSKVRDWLTAFQRVVYREPEPEPEPEPETAVARPEARKNKESITPGAPAMNETVYAEGSYHMQILLKKMEAFERLIKEEKLPRAAIVSSDINNIIANFDPRIYFPKLFSRYSMLVALHIGKLANYEEQKETLEWKAMEEFYRVDLDSFVDFDTDISFSSHAPILDQINNEEKESYEDESYNEEEKSEDDWD